MKKLLALLMFLFMSTFTFSELKDGIYYVEKNNSAWTAFMKMTVKNGKAIGVQYDKKKSDGTLLSMDQKENQKYKSKYSSDFRDMSLEMGRTFVSSQNIDNVYQLKNSTSPDAETLNEFKSMLRFLIDKSNAGQAGTFSM